MDDRDEFLAHRRQLSDIEREASLEYDRAILSLATVSLGFSISIGSFLDRPLKSTPLLFSAWALFGMAIIATTLSFQLSASAARADRRRFDQSYADGDSEDWRPGRLGLVVNCLNWSALGFLLPGLGMLAIFAGRNIN